MPIYEFECESCGTEFERIQSFSDTNVPDCPSCESEKVVRQLGRPAIHFKGSGWYINDSKKASKSSANGSEDGATGDSGSKTDASDTKAEAKTDTKASAKSESSKSTASEPAKSAA